MVALFHVGLLSIRRSSIQRLLFNPTQNMNYWRIHLFVSIPNSHLRHQPCQIRQIQLKNKRAHWEYYFKLVRYQEQDQLKMPYHLWIIYPSKPSSMKGSNGILIIITTPIGFHYYLVKQIIWTEYYTYSKDPFR